MTLTLNTITSKQPHPAAPAPQPAQRGLCKENPAVNATPTENSLLAALYRRHQQTTPSGLPRYVYAEQVNHYGQAIADAVVLDGNALTGDYRKRYCELTGISPRGFTPPPPVSVFEVKISRSDWLRELACPEKAAVWGAYAHYMWLVAPTADIVRPGELPAGWGLMVGDRRLRAVVRPEVRPMPEIPANIAVMVSRYALKTSARYSESELPGTP